MLGRGYRRPTTPRAVAAKWRECAKIHTFRIGTIFHYANLASPGWRAAHIVKRMVEAYSLHGSEK